MVVPIRTLAFLFALLALAAPAALAQSQRPQQDTAPPSSGCLIKGNVSTRGERWFCSEAEAVAAGWRRTKVC